MKNGEEISVAEAETKPKAAKRDLPSVRFNSISSADFVDRSAAKRDGLFSKKQNPVKIMDEEIKTEEDEKAVAFEEPEKDVDFQEIQKRRQMDENGQKMRSMEMVTKNKKIGPLREELAALKTELAELETSFPKRPRKPPSFPRSSTEKIAFRPSLARKLRTPKFWSNSTTPSPANNFTSGNRTKSKSYEPPGGDKSWPIQSTYKIFKTTL